MTAAIDALDRFIAALPQPDTRQMWQELQAARHAPTAARPLVVKARTPEEVTRAVNARANARAEEQRGRIEDAIRGHLQSGHSDHDSVRTLEAPRFTPPAAGTAPPSSPLSAGPQSPRGTS